MGRGRDALGTGSLLGSQHALLGTAPGFHWRMVLATCAVRSQGCFDGGWLLTAFCVYSTLSATIYVYFALL